MHHCRGWIAILGEPEGAVVAGNSHRMSSYEFDPVAVHEFAAQLYWRLAHREGAANIDHRVITTAGEAVLEPSLVNEAMAAMQPLWRLASLPAEALRSFKQQAAAHAFHRVRQEQPLLGQVIFEDAKSGCAPGVKHFVTPGDYDKVRDAPARVSVDRTIPSLGKLVIRSPLPAVVISETPPDNAATIIRIADTSALGVDLTLYLHVQDWDRYVDRYLLIGNFVIPTKDAVQGRAWSRLIPNSTRFYREFKAQGTPDGDLAIATSW